MWLSLNHMKPAENTNYDILNTSEGLILARGPGNKAISLPALNSHVSEYNEK
jgi:hypothetical protein